MAEWAAYFLKHHGKRDMVGKVFAVQLGIHDFVPICVHESRENQRFFKHDSPGGIDAPLLEKLLEEKVPIYIHRYLKNDFSWMIRVDSIVRSPQGVYDGRDRFFPSYDDYDRFGAFATPRVIKEIDLEVKDDYPLIRAAMAAV